MAVVSSVEESPCKPGFDSDLIFKVNKKHLKQSTRLGKVGFTDCTDHTRFLFSTDDSRFVLTTDGVLTVKRAVDLHDGRLDFFVHSLDSQGNKMAVPVMVLHHGHHQRHPDVAVLYFPKSSNGLRRMKRDWHIPPINIPENSNGPFPLKMVTLLAHADMDDPMEIIINVIDMNDNKPIFEQTSYVAEVAESSPKGTTVIQVKATDADEPGNDNSIIKYTILSQEPNLPSDSMFAINSFNGAIMVEGVGLDREKYPEYTLEIQAADTKGEGLTGRTAVVLKVTDSNDNLSVFTASTYQGSVDENAVGVQVVKMSVTDEDEPNTPAWNAKFMIVRGDPDKLFSIETGTNKQEGIIKTAKVVPCLHPKMAMISSSPVTPKGQGHLGRINVTHLHDS
uniref:Cadherin domain-containing protein n=1 Tax=Oryzias latipes TaxID=8090 RepID=A0A3B3IAL9_ORYLA